MAIPGIQEIQTLATKYSKPQLQKMAQMGLVDPTKAVMAGMMIDRIQKQNMQAPQQTVAEEVMGQPQMPQGAPPPSPAGIAGLPSGLPPQMAGGGIVAFAEGGDTEEYAGGGVVAFADRGQVKDAGVTDIVDPGWRSAKTFNRNYTNDDKFAVLAEQLAELTTAERQAQGLDKVRIQKDIEVLRSEMRNLKPSKAVSGLEALIPSAQAIESAPAEPKKSATQEERDRAAITSGFQDFLGGTKKSAEKLGAATKDILSLPIRGVAGAAESVITRPLRAFGINIPYLPDEFYGGDRSSMTPNIDAIRRAEGKDLKNLPETKSSSPQPAPSTTADATSAYPRIIESPAEKFEAKQEVGPARPAVVNRLRRVGIEEPQALTMDKAIEEQDKAYEKTGVSKDLFSQIRQDYESKRGKFKDRADKAAGHALMMFGAGLMGARRGSEGETVSRSAQQSLMMYMNTMDKLSEQDDKLDQSLRELTIAEDQYKRTRADSALSRVQKHQEKIDTIRLENAKLELTAQTEAAKFALGELQVNNPSQWVTIRNIAKSSGKDPVDIFMMANGVAKTGALTLNQALDAVQRNPMFMGKTPTEQMQEAERMVGGGGGGAT
jgi:hypothetical protein